LVALSPSLTQKRWHTAAGCSMLPFPWQGSQTHPDVRSTYSTLRHCKAMPLLVGMEEGPRSKAVVLGGCSIASTARRKLILLLYCRTLYFKVLAISFPTDWGNPRRPWLGRVVSMHLFKRYAFHIWCKNVGCKCHIWWHLILYNL
jgi:hypothetical protein